ncbi:MAG: hypothetical protein AAFY71_21870 [Bacteroidota bacterium]
MKSTIVLFWSILCLQLGFSQSFTKVTGSANDVAINPKDGKVFVIDKNKNLFVYNPSRKAFENKGGRSTPLSNISISRSGIVHAAASNKTGKELKSVNGRSVWSNKGSNISYIACGRDGSLFGVNVYTSSPVRYSNGWRPFSIDPKYKGKVKRMVVFAPTYMIYLLKDNSIVRYIKGKYTVMPGKATDIAIDFANANLYIIDLGKRIRKWDVSSKQWKLLPGTRRDFVSLDAGKGKIWATTTNKSIYRYNPAGGTISATKAPDTRNYTGTYRVTFTRMMGLSQEDRWKHDFYGTIGVYLKGKIQSGGASLDPLGNKPNRVVDLPKNYPTKRRKLSRVVRGTNFEYLFGPQQTAKKGPSLLLPVPVRPINASTSWDLAYPIEKSREFRLVGEAANGEATFDIQMNIKNKLWNGEEGKWERVKLKVKDLKLGKEYMYITRSQGSANRGICFKVEKIR